MPISPGANTVVGAGLAGQLVAANETTYGSAASFASPYTYEFNTESMKLTKNAIQGQGLHGKTGTLPLYDRTRRRVVTTYTAGGGVTMDLPGNGLGFWLTHMLGSYGQTAAMPTPVGGSTGVFTQVHNPGSSLGHSFSMQKGVPAVDGTILPYTYVGCKVTDWQLDVEISKIATLNLTVDARNELAGTGNGDPINATIPSLATPAYPVGMQLFHFREATLYTGGTATVGTGITSISGGTVAGNIMKAMVKHTVGLDNMRIFLGQNGFKSEQLENAYRKISGSFDIEFLSSQAMYNAFANDTTITLELKFVGPQIGTGSDTALLDVIVPNIKLDGETPAIGGPGVINTSIPWTGLDDETTTQIQVKYTSTDSTNT